MTLCEVLFSNANHAQTFSAFWQCKVSLRPKLRAFGQSKVSPCPHLVGVLAVQSVSFPKLKDFFDSAMCFHANILGTFWDCKVLGCLDCQFCTGLTKVDEKGSLRKLVLSTTFGFF